MANGCSPSDPSVGTYLYHACQSMEHLTGHSTSKDELFLSSEPKIFRIYVKLGRATSLRLAGSILRRSPDIRPILPRLHQESLAVGRRWAGMSIRS